MINLNYQTNHILYQIFRIILSTFQQKQWKIDKPSIGLYVNKIGNRITFKIKAECYLELLTPEAIKLLESAKNEITRRQKWWKCTTFWNYRTALVHCNIVNNDYEQDSRVFYTFVPNKPFGSLLDVFPKNHIF